MSLQLVQVHPRDLTHAVERVITSPLRFILWVAASCTDHVSDFIRLPFPEQDLLHIAEATPSLPYLELVVTTRNGRIMGYLCHPYEYLLDGEMKADPTLRAKLVSERGVLLPELRELLKPGTLERLHERIANDSKEIRLKITELHIRDEANAQAAYALVSLLTPVHEIRSSRPAPSE